MKALALLSALLFAAPAAAQSRSFWYDFDSGGGEEADPFSWATDLPPKCDSSGTPGNATCNGFRGIAAIANGAQCITITNSNATGAYQITVSFQATAVNVNSRYPYWIKGTGSFEICANSAASAIYTVHWILWPA
jgi:hypothetical protein